MPALAGGDDPGPFDKWLGSDAPESVPMSAIRAVGSMKANRGLASGRVSLGAMSNPFRYLQPGA